MKSEVVSSGAEQGKEAARVDFSRGSGVGQSPRCRSLGRLGVCVDKPGKSPSAESFGDLRPNPEQSGS